MSSNIEEKFSEHLTKSYYEIWKLYFTDELFHYILEQAKLYAKQNKNDPGFELSLDELKNFIGILIFSGYHFVTSERDYWSNQPDDYACQMTPDARCMLCSQMTMQNNMHACPVDK